MALWFLWFDAFLFKNIGAHLDFDIIAKR